MEINSWKNQRFSNKGSKSKLNSMDIFNISVQFCQFRHFCVIKYAKNNKNIKDLNTCKTTYLHCRHDFSKCRRNTDEILLLWTIFAEHSWLEFGPHNWRGQAAKFDCQNVRPTASKATFLAQISKVEHFTYHITKFFLLNVTFCHNCVLNYETKTTFNYLGPLSVSWGNGELWLVQTSDVLLWLVERKTAGKFKYASARIKNDKTKKTHEHIRRLCNWLI